MTRCDAAFGIEAFALHDLMERVRNYLAAGRRYADVCDAILRDDWVRSYRTFMLFPSPEATALFEDLDAERELRDLREPEVYFNRLDRARMHRNIREAAACPEVQARIAADYEEFRRQWHGASN